MDFTKLKRKKILQVGGKSKYVWLMEHNIIKKTYHRNQPKQLRRFNNEIKLMQHLSNCPFVPKILHIDHKAGAIFMTYVGKKNRL